MKFNRFYYILGLLLCILIGAPIYFTIDKWDCIKNSFFSYTLSDLANLVSTIIIGFVVTIYFTVLMNNSSKRLDIIIENISMYQEYYKSIISRFSKNSKQVLEVSNKQFLVRVFRLASIEYTNIKDYLEYEHLNNKEVKDVYLKILQNHLKFKEHITDKSYDVNYVITENDINTATEYYYQIKQNIQKMKLCLYK